MQFLFLNVRSKMRSLGVLVALLLILTACQPAAAPTATPVENSTPEISTPEISTPEMPTPEMSTAQVPSEAVINVANDPNLGPILVGGNGMTLYIFTNDGPNQSNCDASCLTRWPPLLTQGQPALGEGVDPSLVGTATLADGSMIVTYNKMPLYYWYKDTKAGDTTGQGVGDVWYVISPDGKPVED